MFTGTAPPTQQQQYLFMPCAAIAAPPTTQQEQHFHVICCCCCSFKNKSCKLILFFLCPCWFQRLPITNSGFPMLGKLSRRMPRGSARTRQNLKICGCSPGVKLKHGRALLWMVKSHLREIPATLTGNPGARNLICVPYRVHSKPRNQKVT